MEDLTCSPKKTQIKRKRVINKILKGIHPTKAYKDVYKCKEVTASSEVSRLLSSEEVRKDISNALDSQGLTLMMANDKLRYLIDNPTKPIVIGHDIIQAEDKRLLLDGIKELHKLHRVSDTAPTTLIDNRSITYNATSNKEMIAIATRLEKLTKQLADSKITGEITEPLDIEGTLPNES